MSDEAPWWVLDSEPAPVAQPPATDGPAPSWAVAPPPPAPSADEPVLAVSSPPCEVVANAAPSSAMGTIGGVVAPTEAVPSGVIAATEAIPVGSGAAAATEFGGEASSADGVRPVPPGLRLPDQLAHRYVPEGMFTGGAEGLVLLASEVGTGQQVVVKWYDRSVSADPALLDLLQRADPRHVARLREWGEAEGRHYEVTDYQADGTLAGMLAAEGAPGLAGELVATVVREVVDALEHLHRLADERAGIRFVHGDLKPENVLVRDRPSCDLVLTDFGTSFLADRSLSLGGTRWTPLYAAPEQLAGAHQAGKTDLWSLGVIALVLSMGRHPLAGMDGRVVQLEIQQGRLDPTVVLDERVRLLCQGLLVVNYERRWGFREVRQWLDGGTPPVPDQGQVGGGATAPHAYELGGVAYRDPAALAVAMASDWDAAIRSVLGNESGRRSLSTWLAGHDHLEPVRLLLGTWQQAPGMGADERLVAMLEHLAPDVPGLPFRSVDLARGGLAALAREAVAESEGPATRAVAVLYDQHLLERYERLAAGEEVRGIDERWSGAMGRCEAVLGASPDASPNVVDALRAPARARLLLATVDPSAASALLAEARVARRSLGRRTPAVPEIVGDRGGEGDDVGAAVAVVALAPLVAERTSVERAERRRTRRRRVEARARAGWRAGVRRLPKALAAGAVVAGASAAALELLVVPEADLARRLGLQLGLWCALTWLVLEVVTGVLIDAPHRPTRWSRTIHLIGLVLGGLVLARSLRPMPTGADVPGVDWLSTAPTTSALAWSLALVLLSHAVVVGVRVSSTGLRPWRLVGVAAALLVPALLVAPQVAGASTHDVFVTDAERAEAVERELAAMDPTEREAFVRLSVGMPDRFRVAGTSSYEGDGGGYQVVLGVAPADGRLDVFASAAGGTDMVGPESLCAYGPSGRQLALLAVRPDEGATDAHQRFRGVIEVEWDGPGTYRLAWACERYSAVQPVLG